MKHTDAQRLIEEQEQAIAKMTLRHQLELKVCPLDHCPTSPQSYFRYTRMIEKSQIDLDELDGILKQTLFMLVLKTKIIM